MTHGLPGAVHTGKLAIISGFVKPSVWLSSIGDHLDTKILSPENVYYKADDSFNAGTRWRPSIFMPRCLSRITLEVVNIRVERLQEISYDDCCLETGAPLKWEGEGPEPYYRDMKAVFRKLWNDINGKRGYGWADNPWVWVVEFKVSK